MHITMAIIIGQYSGSLPCPRLGCSSGFVSDAGLKGVARTLWYDLSPNRRVLKLTISFPQKFLLWDLGAKVV